jgi:hypothetical protein
VQALQPVAAVVASGQAGLQHRLLSPSPGQSFGPVDQQISGSKIYAVFEAITRLGLDRRQQSQGNDQSWRSDIKSPSHPAIVAQLFDQRNCL